MRMGCIMVGSSKDLTDYKVVGAMIEAPPDGKLPSVRCLEDKKVVLWKISP